VLAAGEAAALKRIRVFPLASLQCEEREEPGGFCMLGRLAVVVLVFSWLPDCKGVGEPGTFEKFVSPTPAVFAEMCSTSNVGKRFWLEGYLQLPSSISIREGRTSLNFFARVDGSGRGAGKSIPIEVTSPGDIDDLWTSATGKKTTYGGYRSRSESAQIGPDALRVRAKNGAATDRDKIKLAFDITPTWHFQTGELYVCRYHFAKAEKI
jgi:hypothetical protein